MLLVDLIGRSNKNHLISETCCDDVDIASTPNDNDKNVGEKKGDVG